MDMPGFDNHDHHVCVKDGVEAAVTHCKDNGLQLTPVRKRVLEILLERQTPLGAYDILDILSKEGYGSQPPVAYRALDFLVKNRFAHKIERLNAFIACSQMGKSHAPIFMICNSCEAVAEAHADPENSQILALANESGFSVDRLVAEVTGTCPECQ
ncbi:MAG: Fur family transcriptional regulator [Pseudomonadota bacterium]